MQTISPEPWKGQKADTDSISVIPATNSPAATKERQNALITAITSPLLLDTTTPIPASFDKSGLATQETLATRAGETTASAIKTKLDGEITITNAKGVPAQGSVTVGTAGTAVQMPNKAIKNYMILQWVPANTGPIYYGSATTGNNFSAPFLNAENPRVVLQEGNANAVWVNADVSDSKVVWYAS